MHEGDVKFGLNSVVFFEDMEHGGLGGIGSEDGVEDCVDA